MKSDTSSRVLPMLSALLMEYEAIGKSENNLHWCLDVLFADDECTVLDRNAAEN